MDIIKIDKKKYNNRRIGNGEKEKRKEFFKFLK